MYEKIITNNNIVKMQLLVISLICKLLLIKTQMNPMYTRAKPDTSIIFLSLFLSTVCTYYSQDAIFSQFLFT